MESGVYDARKFNAVNGSALSRGEEFASISVGSLPRAGRGCQQG
jgi:hypothetical protein